MLNSIKIKNKVHPKGMINCEAREGALGYNGFTLVEVIVYTALFALLMTGFVGFSLSVTGLYSKAKSIEEVLSSTRQIERVINYYIKNRSDEVTSPLLSQTSSSLGVNVRDGSSGIFYLDNGRLMLQINSNDPLTITSNEVVIRDLSFSNYSTSEEFDSIKITCLISFAAIDSVEYIYNYDFNMTVNTRN